MKKLAVILACAMLVGCDSTPSKPDPHTIAQIISAIPPWDRKVLDLATDDQLFTLYFFGGSAIAGIWWALVKGVASVVSAWRFPPPSEPESDDDDN
jgi:hypothetical protein